MTTHSVSDWETNPVYQQLEQAVFVAGLSGWAFAVIASQHLFAGLSSNMQTLLAASAIALLAAFIGSASRIVRMLMRLVEAVVRQRLRRWAKAQGVDPDELLDDPH